MHMSVYIGLVCASIEASRMGIRNEAYLRLGCHASNFDPAESEIE